MNAATLCERCDLVATGVPRIRPGVYSGTSITVFHYRCECGHEFETTRSHALFVLASVCPGSETSHPVTGHNPAGRVLDTALTTPPPVVSSGPPDSTRSADHCEVRR